MMVRGRINALVALHDIETIVSKAALGAIYVSNRKMCRPQYSHCLSGGFAVEQMVGGSSNILLAGFRLRRA